MSISTHVLDAGLGRPAAGIEVRLERRDPAGWHQLARAHTDADGRIGTLAATAEEGVYRIIFDVEGFAGPQSFYPEVAVTFRITDPRAHHHIPLLLSPFAYSTYRGS